MKLLNGVNGANVLLLLLLLAFSSLFSATTAICVPRNYSAMESPHQKQHQKKQAPSPAESPFAYAPESPKPEPESESESESEAGSESESESETESDSEPVLSLEQEKEKERSDADGGGLEGIFSTTVSPTATKTTDLGEICDVTSNPKLCKNSISSHIEGATNPTSALKTEIEESIKQVEKAVATLNTLKKDSAASKMEVTVYETCLESFDMAISDLNSGMESIDTKDTGAMESNLAAVMSNIVTCDDTFDEMGIESPLDNLSTKMQKYASNCLAISKLLL